MKKLIAIVALFGATLVTYGQIGGVNIENLTGLDIHCGVQFTNSPCMVSAPDDVDFDLLDGNNTTINIPAVLALLRVGVVYSGSNYTMYSPCLPGCGPSMPAAPFTISWSYSPDCRWFKLILS